MECREIRDRLLSDYLDDRLMSEEKKELEGHLSGCASCGAELRVLQLTVRAVGQLSVETMPDAAAERLRRRLGISEPAIATEPGRVSWLPRWLTSPIWPVAATAVILLAVVVVMFSGLRTQSALKAPAAKAPAAATSPRIIAEFGQTKSYGENKSAEELPEQQTSASPVDRQEAKPKESPALENRSGQRLSLLAISNSNYSDENIRDLLNAAYANPAPTYQEQVEQLTYDVGRPYSVELKRTLKVARRRSPASMPVYVELAYYRNEAAWIIVMVSESEKKVLVIER